MLNKLCVNMNIYTRVECSQRKASFVATQYISEHDAITLLALEDNRLPSRFASLHRRVDNVQGRLAGHWDSPAADMVEN